MAFGLVWTETTQSKIPCTRVRETGTLCYIKSEKVPELLPAQDKRTNPSVMYGTEERMNGYRRKKKKVFISYRQTSVLILPIQESRLQKQWQSLRLHALIRSHCQSIIGNWIFMYGDEERNKKMEKGEHLKRQNRPTMLQLQYLQRLSKVEKKRGAQGSIAEYYGVNRSNVNRYFKSCIERGILTESLEFTPAGEEWLERYSNLYENLEKISGRNRCKNRKKSRNHWMLWWRISTSTCWNWWSMPMQRKKSVYKKKENELDQETAQSAEM